jgi:hypothetical protein
MSYELHGVRHRLVQLAPKAHAAASYCTMLVILAAAVAMLRRAR